MQPGGDERRPAMSARQLLRQQRELEEKRKFGLAPLAVDSVTQTEISPNVPQTLAQAPWFYGATGPTLAHQRQRDVARNDVIDDAGDVVTVHAPATHYVAGACKNCGARTHKTHECTQAKKKVGAVYTGRVTGHDVTVTRVERSYAQKRDRYAGDVGVDLLRGYDDTDGGDAGKAGGGDATTATADVDNAPRRRVEDVFASRTAQHGGVEIKELPKYLQSLDAPPDALFFDHRTGAMRANPNAHDTTRTFRGDLERYRSGDYYNYVETQYRFLSGQSRSFVDFAYDDEMRRARDAAHVQSSSTTANAGGVADEHGGGGSSTGHNDTVSDGRGGSDVHGDHGDKANDSGSAVQRTHDEVVLRALRADVSPVAVREGSVGGVVAEAVLPTAAAVATATRAETVVSVEQQQLLQLSLLPMPTYNGHRLPYGSHLDTATFTWGYGCCRRLGKHAPSCAP